MAASRTADQHPREYTINYETVERMRTDFANRRAFSVYPPGHDTWHESWEIAWLWEEISQLLAIIGLQTSVTAHL